MPDIQSLPKSIFSGTFHTGHCQGIAVDTERRVIYYSFTTQLVKTDLEGNFLGSVTGLLGHLGCIVLNPEDHKVYGSLEYKNDAIGAGILSRIGADTVQDGFYIAIFDGEKITAENQNAERDGIMRAAFLTRVTEDYLGTAENGKKHIRGCSGIDGTAIGPVPGEEDKKPYLFVSYGVYSDTEREDNDYQILLKYDIAELNRYAMPLSQENMHRSGAEMKEEMFCVYTGNTTYGVQNLEYDPYTETYVMAVYCGKKPGFPNLPMYLADAKVPAREEVLKGCGSAVGKVLQLAPGGEEHPSGVNGYRYPYGSTGFAALGGGYYYVSYDETTKEGWNTTVRLCKWNGIDPIAPVE
ncbi:MAG: hypothetical protein MJ175_03405 [Clostridia bacterium]|nr:hypothetical protein [Clostridia bacterium]